MMIYFSDWIALNVLRTVALSTNSVAASVEPVIQQQFFTLSPMQGQEQFGGGTAGAHAMLGDGPTTSSMLAALQDPFAGSALDPSGATDPYMAMGFGVDHSGAHDSSGMFGEYGAGGAFDVPGFTPHDLGLNSDAASVHSHASEHSSPEQGDPVSSSVKDEGPSS